MSNCLAHIVFGLYLFFTVGSAHANETKTREEKEIEVTVRMIGHKLLEQSGDSTSRVLPIEQKGNVFYLNFANDFVLYPDDLIALSDRYISTLGYKDKVLVEVKDCANRQIVHSFEVHLSKMGGELQPCRARELEKACYYIQFTFFGKPLNNEEQAQEAYDTASNSMIRLFVFLLLLIGVVFLYRYQKKKKKDKMDPNLIKLGKFYFDKRKTELVLEKQIIELTSKEADLLVLLYENANETVKREKILNVVWGDEGDYVGRTLDVFISKLRKKLEADPNVKISNVRGVGYRLVVV